MARKYFSVTDKKTCKTGYASIGDLGFEIGSGHIVKLLIFLDMLPEGEYISEEIDADTYFSNVNESELEEYAYV